MAFKDGDLVRIIRQPANQHVQIEGLTGYVELDPNHGGYVSVNAINLDGSMAGCGSVPTGCVELCLEPEWLDAYKERIRQMEGHEQVILQWDSDLLDAKIRVAEKMGLSVDTVMEVLEMWDQEKPTHPFDQ